MAQSRVYNRKRLDGVSSTEHSLAFVYGQDKPPHDRGSGDRKNVWISTASLAAKLIPCWPTRYRAL